MIYNNKKHFYDPYDSLDAEWKARISHGMLSVREAAHLSGFSRQYINKLIANGIIDAKKNNDGICDCMDKVRQMVLGSSNYTNLPYRLCQLLFERADALHGHEQMLGAKVCNT